MKNIESIIRLNCNEELDIRYFAKDGSITDTTCDYSELLEYINEIEDKNARLHSIIKEVREYINKIPTQPVIRVFKKELLEILDKE